MMKIKLLIIFICLGSLMCFAQDDTPSAIVDDKANDIVPILYDFASSQPLKNLLPFDKYFAVKFINIGDSINSIVFKVYVINDESYSFKHYRNMTGKEMAFQEIKLKSNNKILKSDPLLRNVNFSGEEASTVFSFKLRPNHNYILEVETRMMDDLSEAQRGILSESLKGDKELTHILAATADDPRGGFSDILIESLNSAATRVAQEVNPLFVLTSPEYTDQLNQMTVALDKLSDAFLIFEDDGAVESHLNSDLAINKTINQGNLLLVEEKIDDINWGNVTLTDHKYDGLVLSIDAMINGVKDTTVASELREDKEMFLDAISEYIDTRDGIFEDLIDFAIVDNIYLSRVLSSTYPQDFVKQARMYITIDAGLAYVWKLDRANFYTGLNVYFRPLDKTIPLTYYRRFGDVILTRASFLIGFSLSSVYQENVRKGLLDDNKALILGLGFRVTPWLKFNGGSYLYYKYDPNPLVSDSRYQFTGAPFVSMSIDIDVKPLFEGIGEAVFKQ